MRCTCNRRPLNNEVLIVGVVSCYKSRLFLWSWVVFMHYVVNKSNPFDRVRTHFFHACRAEYSVIKGAVNLLLLGSSVFPVIFWFGDHCSCECNQLFGIFNRKSSSGASLCNVLVIMGTCGILEYWLVDWDGCSGYKLCFCDSLVWRRLTTVVKNILEP